MNKWSLEKPVVAMPIIILLNTLAMIWVGGVEHFQEKTPLLSGLFFLILYIIVSEAWQLIGRNMYYHQRQFTWPIYGTKLLISLVLIVIIACQSRFILGILLLMYELYQTLLYRNDWQYMNHFYYCFMNGFFKGFIINIILAVGVPFTLSFSGLFPYFLPFLLFMMQGVLYQIMYTDYNRRSNYFITFTVLAALCVVVLILTALKHPFLWISLILFVVYFGALLYIFKNTHKKRLEQETYIALFLALSIITCCSIV